GTTKMAFGTSQVTRTQGTGAVVSLGDDLKAAATDALKKCATFLGVGLHLYAERPLRPEPGRPGWTGLIPSAVAVPAGFHSDRNGASGAAPVVSPSPAPPA